MTNIIYVPNWITLLSDLHRYPEDYALSLIKRDDSMTFSSAYRLINEFVKKGWVIKQRKGRTVRLLLTYKGKRIALNCYNLLNRLNNISESEWGKETY